MPAGTTHDIEMVCAVSVRTLYLRPDLSYSLPKHCHAIEVSPLLRELILYTIGVGMLDTNLKPQRRLIEVIVDQLNAVQASSLKLIIPSDPRSASHRRQIA